MDTIFPEVGKEYTFRGMPAKVTAVGKRGRPRKDGTQGGWVEYETPSWDEPGSIDSEIRVTLAVWQKGAQ